MMPAVLIVFTLFILAIAIEKEVMRKVRKFRFRRMLAKENLPNLEDHSDYNYHLDEGQSAPAGD